MLLSDEQIVALARMNTCQYECHEACVERVAKALLQAVVDDLKERIGELRLHLKGAEGAEIFSIEERIDELELTADIYEQELK